MNDGRFKGQITIGGKRYSRIFDDVRSAYAWEAKALERVANGLAPEEHSEITNLEQLCNYVSYTQWATQKAAHSSIANARAVVEILGPNTPVAGITAAAAETVRAHCRSHGLRGSTINRKLAALSTLSKTAYRLGILPRIPDIRRETEPEPRSRVLSKDEQTKLFAWLSPEVRNLCRFLVASGMRLGEARALKWTAVNFERKQVTLRFTKSNKPRTIPLSDEALEVLRSRYHDSVEEDKTAEEKTGVPQYYYINEGPFCELTNNIIYSEWAAARRATGMADDDQIVIHSLRHTFATRLIEAGASLIAVKSLLGHSSIRVTERYAHADSAHLAEAIELLSLSSGDQSNR